jgi:hypothetical protein
VSRIFGDACHPPLGTSASVSEQVAPFSGAKKPETTHLEWFRVLYRKTKKLENRRFLQNDLFQLGPKRAGLQPIAD